MKKLEYHILVLSLTADEYGPIIAPVFTLGISKACIFKTMPRAVLYGDVVHQGMTFYNLYTEMGVQKIQAHVNHI